MHRLIVMRHAKAEPSTGEGDHGRPLSAVGRADAALMGRVLAERGLRPDVALVSDSRRTRETWDGLHEALGDVDVRLEARLYNASAALLRGRVEDLEDEAGCLLVLGHNPGVHELAVEYLTQAAASPALADRLAGGFPPGSAAVFAVDAAGRLTPEGVLAPKDLGGGRA